MELLPHTLISCSISFGGWFLGWAVLKGGLGLWVFLIFWVFLFAEGTKRHCWSEVVKGPLGDPSTFPLVTSSECLYRTVDFIFWVSTLACLVPFAMFSVRIYGNAQCFSCALLLSGYSILTPAGVNMSESRNFHLLSRHLFAALGSSCVSVFCGSQRSHALCLTLWLILIKYFF